MLFMYFYCIFYNYSYNFDVFISNFDKVMLMKDFNIVNVILINYY